MDEKKGNKGIWIPKEIWLDKNLNMLEKLALNEVYNIDVTPMKNDRPDQVAKILSDFLDIGISKCYALLKSLECKGYIKGFVYEK